MTIRQRKIFHYLPLFILLFLSRPAAAQMHFVENKGQWNNEVQYRGDFTSGAFFLQQQGFTVMLHNTTDLAAITARLHGHPNTPNTEAPLVLRSHAYKVDFLGADRNAIQDVPDKKLNTYNNYFEGSDQSKWASNCHLYEAVTYQNVYPHIDVRYYSDAGKLKYDIIVKPGGNPEAIAMRYTGADNLQVKDKELVIGTSCGTVKELYPYSYQAYTGKRTPVECKYVVRDNVVRFKVKDYVPTETLIIDPTLIFSTFTGSPQDNWGYTATPGPDGSLFAGGISISGAFPVTTGAYQTVFGGGNVADYPGPYDIAIMKFTAISGDRVYATYLGGNGNEQPHSMICDAQGNLVVAGRSSSSNFPLKPAGNKLGPGGAYDIVITKFNASGTAILGSVRIGGTSNDGVNIRPKYTGPDGDDETRRNYGDDARSEVILDNSNNILLASCTQSSDFYINNASGIQPAFAGSSSAYHQDGVILKFSPDLSTNLFSTFYGGGGDDACFVLSLNPVNGKLYVAGATTSNNIPGNKTGVIGPSYAGGETDGFVTEIQPDGSGIIKTSYFGTGGADLIYGIQFDKLGFPYITGTTTGSWTVVNAAFSNPGAKQFISKLQPDLSAYVYSTVFGAPASKPNISPTAFLVDRCQNVYVSGWGGGINIYKLYSSSGTGGMPEVNPIPGIPAADGADFFFFVLEKNAQSQLFGSHFGHNGGQIGDHVDGGTSRFDANGVIYQAVCSCLDGGGPFPTTPGVWAATNGSPACNEAVMKIEMNFAGVGASVKATINGVVDTIGCVPLTINFTDTLARGKMYVWDYGDPSYSKRDTTYAPNNSTSHVYSQVGVYHVMLISVDSATCNITDTAHVTVKVGNNDVHPEFSFVKLDSCNSLRYQFNNLTTAALPNYTNKTFTWDFGDGSPRVQTGFAPVIHTFPSTGTYKIWLIVDDTTFCNSPDSVSHLLRISPNVKALFTTPSMGCVPYTAVFKNISQGGTDFYWEFGDGPPLLTLDNNPTVTHTYANTGTYQVRLIAIDTSTCNKIDTSAYFPITVYPIPTAGFSWTPNPPLENTITRFINNSQGAVRYKWYFGDGDSSTATSPAHQYNATGTYRAVLKAYNVANCVDSAEALVPIIIRPLLDVPNAFTPGRNGVNAVVKVAGFGIGKMQWKIYNRWGQVVFETTDRNQGWDGTFKGAVQAMDVYTYTLDVEFTDGQKLRKTGDITLLR
ncbi:MAG: PKD domain-containing protein [Ferruginibacter sp.]